MQRRSASDPAFGPIIGFDSKEAKSVGTPAKMVG